MYFKIRCIRIVSACICTVSFCIFVSNVQIHEIRTYLCAYLDTRSRYAGYGSDTVQIRLQYEKIRVLIENPPIFNRNPHGVDLESTKEPFAYLNLVCQPK